DVLDYHYQYDYSENLRIKALSTELNPVIINSSFTAYCEPGNIGTGDPVQFEWFIDDVPVVGQNQSQATLTAPANPAEIVLKCRITANGQTAEDTLHLLVVDRIPLPPVVNGIQSASRYTAVGETNTFTAMVEPAPGEILEYQWSSTAGVLNQNTGSSVTWTAPESPVVGSISVQVSNQDLLSTNVSTGALVKDTTLAVQAPLIWYPFDQDNKNMAADRFHATVSGATKTEDARGAPSLAYRFTSGSNIIYTENHADLNFGDAISLSCWVKCEQFGSERFIISHGSWQQRYKISITPEGYLRWTVKTNTGVADLDGSTPIELNRYTHVAVLYTGYSMEMYVDGILDSFKDFSGTIQPSTKPITIGRMDNTETLYALRGSVDEVKLWDREIPVPQVEKLKTLWATPIGIEENELQARIWPNPAEDMIFVELIGNMDIVGISLLSSDGRELQDCTVQKQHSGISIKVPVMAEGLYLLRVATKDGHTATRKIIIR
ncbi:MAG: T9SS type A sorting domain-containing protein, partial [Lentimicrobium sp.]|nr:T9SS type A sorting domain-containing protein [Lentimicrobium sp.]